MENSNTPTDLHVGRLIKAELKRQGRTAVWLAKQVNRTPDCIYKVLNTKWPTMYLLLEISQVLDHDFFQYCSAYLKANRTA